LVEKKFETYVRENTNRFAKDVARLASQPSVSARNQGIEECAALVEKMMREVGIQTKALRMDGVAPLLYGEMKSSNSRKTILFYITTTFNLRNRSSSGNLLRSSRNSEMADSTAEASPTTKENSSRG